MIRILFVNGAFWQWVFPRELGYKTTSKYTYFITEKVIRFHRILNIFILLDSRIVTRLREKFENPRLTRSRFLSNLHAFSWLFYFCALVLSYEKSVCTII